jgi:spermidine synthase
VTISDGYVDLGDKLVVDKTALLIDTHHHEDAHVFLRVASRAKQRSPFQLIEIAQLEPLGWSLLLDDEVQSSETDERLYHELLVHPAMLAHPHPRRVLILGGGEGATLREVLRHRAVEHAAMVEIDQEVIRLCREHLPSWHDGAFDDPRARVTIGDACDYLRDLHDGEKFDVIFGDLTDPGDVGPATDLYSESFFRLVRGALADGGTYVTHAGGVRPPLPDPYARGIIGALGQLFPMAVPYAEYIPSYDRVWVFVMATTTRRPLPPSAEVERRIRARNLHVSHYGGPLHQHAFGWPFLTKLAATL